MLIKAKGKRSLQPQPQTKRSIVEPFRTGATDADPLLPLSFVGCVYISCYLPQRRPLNLVGASRRWMACKKSILHRPDVWFSKATICRTQRRRSSALSHCPERPTRRARKSLTHQASHSTHLWHTSLSCWWQRYFLSRPLRGAAILGCTPIDINRPHRKDYGTVTSSLNWSCSASDLPRPGPSSVLDPARTC